jgi:hypothetical protein
VVVTVKVAAMAGNAARMHAAIAKAVRRNERSIREAPIDDFTPAPCGGADYMVAPVSGCREVGRRA